MSPFEQVAGAIVATRRWRNSQPELHGLRLCVILDPAFRRELLAHRDSMYAMDEEKGTIIDVPYLVSPLLGEKMQVLMQTRRLK